MRQCYTHPSVEMTDIQPQQVLCGSGGSGGGFKAQIGDYESNTGGGFIQE